MRTRGPALFLATLVLPSPAAAGPVPCPHVLFVIDTSESMAEDVEGRAPTDPAFVGPSKLELAQYWLANLIKSDAWPLPMGLALAASTRADSDAACLASAAIAAPVGQVGLVYQKLGRASAAGRATLGETVALALATPGTAPDGVHGMNLVILTDGKLGCTAADTPDGDYTVAQIARARAASLSTLVVGFEGAGVRADVLQRLAIAGGKPRTGTCASHRDPCYEVVGPTDADFLQRFPMLIGLKSSCDDTCLSAGCPAATTCRVTEFNPTPHCEPDGPAGDASPDPACPSTDGPCLPPPPTTGCTCSLGSARASRAPAGPEACSIALMLLALLLRRLAPRLPRVLSPSRSPEGSSRCRLEP